MYPSKVHLEIKEYSNTWVRKLHSTAVIFSNSIASATRVSGRCHNDLRLLSFSAPCLILIIEVAERVKEVGVWHNLPGTEVSIWIAEMSQTHKQQSLPFLKCLDHTSYVIHPKTLNPSDPDHTHPGSDRHPCFGRWLSIDFLSLSAFSTTGYTVASPQGIYLWQEWNRKFILFFALAFQYFGWMRFRRFSAQLGNCISQWIGCHGSNHSEQQANEKIQPRIVSCSGHARVLFSVLLEHHRLKPKATRLKIRT